MGRARLGIGGIWSLHGRQSEFLNQDEELRTRADGSSTDIFVFCLSTRAGGLGINLTAADTVIFCAWCQIETEELEGLMEYR